MRVLIWHGWLLEGSGSNVAAAKVVQVLRDESHEVLVLCQEGHPERFDFIDATGTVDADAVSSLTPTGQPAAAGTFSLLRPDIGSLLPVFVYDEYEGFEVKPFPDLRDDELASYLDRNVRALRTAAEWWKPDATFLGHAVPGAVLGLRALGKGGYVAKVHGSDLEYAVKLQPRYADLAREGLEGARSVTGATRDVLNRAVEVAPRIAGRTLVVPPGVEIDRFFPRPRGKALLEVADLLDADPDTERGRPDDLDEEVRSAAGDPRALDALAGRYDQSVPDRGAGSKLRSLAGYGGPMVGYFGKLIPQKGVEVLLRALPQVGRPLHCLIVGFGLHREHLTALVQSLGLTEQVTFTGRLDHRYAPQALAALDVCVVPSVLEEAFGMVAAEAAAAGALPLVARHSGLAEVAEALERAVGRPGWLSYRPGPEATANLASGLRKLLDLPDDERRRLRQEVASFVASTWTWDRTAKLLLKAAEGPQVPTA
jgi:glycosyltransferase involved in cell wall biosynthesis